MTLHASELALPSACNLPPGTFLHQVFLHESSEPDLITIVFSIDDYLTVQIFVPWFILEPLKVYLSWDGQ